jgi:hypothetical protein
MNYNTYFLELISKLLAQELSRLEVSSLMSANIGIDDISGDSESLLKNCEWALRHANEKDYYTTIGEFVYLKSCLSGEKKFSCSARDASITNSA